MYIMEIKVLTRESAGAPHPHARPKQHLLPLSGPKQAAMDYQSQNSILTFKWNFHSLDARVTWSITRLDPGR